MSDEFKRELREIGSRLKVRREATLNAQQDQLSRVEAAIQWWEKGIASNIKQAVQEANTALAETGVSLACAEGTAGPVDSGGRVGPGLPKTRPKITITIIEDDGFERNKQLEISLTQGGTSPFCHSARIAVWSNSIKTKSSSSSLPLFMSLRTNASSPWDES
jgi:hypothetical protein